MDSLHVATSHGPVALVGRLHVKARPLLLVIGGVFPPREFKDELVDAYPGATVLINRLPGMGAPWQANSRPETVAAALDEALARLVPNDPIVAHGVSTGCLVSLRLKAPNVVHHILEEPFFSTAELWPVVEIFRRQLAEREDSQKLAEFLWEFFGLSATEFPGRSHRDLIDQLGVPADVVVGGAPLEPQRRMDGWPSLTSLADRRLLAANSLVTLHEDINNFGHDFGLMAPGRAKIAALTLRALHASVAKLKVE